MQLDLLFEAIITGFILSIMIGPAFFVLLETSIKKGIRAGLAFDLGILLSDVIYIMIAYIFYAKVEALTEGSSSFWLKTIGGSLFLIYGLYNLFLKKPAKELLDQHGKIIQPQQDYGFLILKGFILNMANPLVIFYWFTVMTVASNSVETGGTHVLFFLTLVLSTFIGFDVLKIIGAKKLRPLVTPAVLKGINRFIGIVFVGFGLFLAIGAIIDNM